MINLRLDSIPEIKMRLAKAKDKLDYLDFNKEIKEALDK
jgi:hypothetical protein